MKNAVFIDGNVWNFVFDRKLDLAIELPADEFSICHTREAEFEIPVGKLELDVFNTSTLARCNIQTGSYLGSRTTASRRTNNGSAALTSAASPAMRRSRSSRLRRHRRSCGRPSCRNTKPIFHCGGAIVPHRRAEPGPQKHGASKRYDQRGKVVYLDDFDASSPSLAEFIKARMRHQPKLKAADFVSAVTEN
jgi:hypothetical protein